MSDTSIKTVKIELTVILGKTTMPVNQLLRMGRGAVIELETLDNDEVEIQANNIAIAKADVIVQGDRIGIQITEKLKAAEVSY
ncbi:MAG: FliM/FliN family flagellar motor switch protein [Pseudomonadota bacterium]